MIVTARRIRLRDYRGTSSSEFILGIFYRVRPPSQFAHKMSFNFSSPLHAG
jgi:hypothetical protein